MTETYIDPESVTRRQSWADMLSRRDDRPMSTMKNNTEETQVFEGDDDPHYFGILIENPTAEEWAEAVRVYVGNPDGEPFEVAIKSDGTLTLIHLGDFGVVPGSEYLVKDPTAEQWADAVSRYLNPAMGDTGACVRVAHRWDGNLSLFECENFDAVKPGECYTVGQAQSEIAEGMRRPELV